MKEPKQKPKMKAPKMIDQTGRTVNSARRILTERYKRLEQEQREHLTQSPTDYAANQMEEKGRAALSYGKQRAKTILRGGKYVVKGGIQATRRIPRTRDSRAQGEEGDRQQTATRGPQGNGKRRRSSPTSNNPQGYGERPGVPATSGIRQYTERPAGVRCSTASPTQGTDVAKRKLRIKRQADFAVNRQNVQKAVTNGEIRRNIIAERQWDTIIKTPRSAGPTQPHARTIKTAASQRRQGQPVKHPRLKQGPKTAQAVAHAARKKAQKKAQHAAQQQAAKRVAMATKKAVRRIAIIVKRVVIAAAKAFKTTISAIVAGGPVLICIVIFGVIAVLIASPFGVFWSKEDDSPDVTPLTEVVEAVNAEFEQRIQDIIDDHSYCDSVEMHYVGSTDGAKINNWMDVIAVFAVKTAMDENGMEVVTIDETRIELIKAVFWDMNLIDYYVEEIEHLDDEGDIDWIEYILHITITSKSAEEQAEEYGFTDEQKEIMREMLSGEFLSYILALLGLDPAGELTEEEWEDIYGELDPDEIGSQAVEWALTRLGDPYSIPKAGTDRYTDCSHLMQWAYGKVGVSLPRRASIQAQVLANAKRSISYGELIPGDLVFWSYENNGNYMNISHVGIYAGGGKVVHASSVEMQVVIEPLFHADKQVMYARPTGPVD